MDDQHLISVKDIIGQMARYAVLQHPYNDPPQLGKVIKAIKKHAKPTFLVTPGVMPMRWFASRSELDGWICEAVETCWDVMRIWNTPKSGHDAPFIATSRHGGPKPEDDFIDIDALIRNVAMAAWNDTAEYSKPVAA